jgi:hypothetical protein
MGRTFSDRTGFIAQSSCSHHPSGREDDRSEKPEFAAPQSHADPSALSTSRKSVQVFLAIFIGTLALYLALVILVDPYDSGRFPTPMPAGTPSEKVAILNLSRGRDPRFNSVVLGNSRAVMIDPGKLSQGTPFRFVQLAVEGATVRDQMTFLRWFERHHPAVEAIVLESDQGWCERDLELTHSPDFPSGLYARSDFDYLRAALNLKSFNIMLQRLAYAFHWRPAVDPAHFISIEAKYPWKFDANGHAAWHKTRIAGVPQARDLPALRLLSEALSELRHQPAIVLWLPPYFATALPPTDTDEGQDLEACKEGLRAWARRRPNTVLLDFQLRTHASENPDNFLDVTHARRRLLASVEEEISATLGRLE